MKRTLGATAIVCSLVVANAVSVPSAAAQDGPPPPPPTPGCGYCGGPPPPPTLVPTLSTSGAPSVVIVSVRVDAKVKRGHTQKLRVRAAAHGDVSAIVRYRTGKLTTFHGKVSVGGTLVKTWKIPSVTALGTASVKVVVKSSISPYKGTLTFVVTK